MSDFLNYIDSLSPEERKKRLEILQKIGVSPATNDGFWTELSQGFSKGFVEGVRGFGKTAQEFGISSADDIVNWADKTLENNQQWNAHEDYTPLSLNLGNIGRTIGSGLGQTSTIAPAAIGASFVGSPLAGAAIVGSATFAQLYGDNVEDYRNKFKGKYSSGQIAAMAVGKTLVDSTIETALGNVPMLGKISKTIVNKATKSAMQETVKKFGQSATIHILKEAGKGAIGEGSEEVLQFFNDAAFRALAGDENLDVKFKDVLENFAGGAWSGGLMGSVSGITTKPSNIETNGLIDNPNTYLAEKHFKSTPSDKASNESLSTVLEGLEGMDAKVGEDVEVVTPKTKAAKMLKQLGTELGLDVNFFTPLTDKGMGINGAFNENDNRIWIDASKSAEDPRFTLGHEFYHFLNKNNPELAKTFKDLVYSKQSQENEDIKIYNEEKQELEKEYQEGWQEEFVADRFGEIFKDAEVWNRIGQSNNVKFSQQLMEYINKFLATVKKLLSKNPNAVNFIKDLEEFKQKSIDEVLVPYISNLQSPQTEQVVQSESMFDTPSLDKSLLDTPSLEKSSLDSSSLDKSSFETTDLGAKNIVDSIVGKPNTSSMLNKSSFGKSSLDKPSLDKSSFDTPAQVETPKQESDVKAEVPAEAEVKEEVAKELTEPKAETEEKSEAEPKVNLAKEQMKKVLFKLYTKGAKGKIIDKDLNFYETLRLLKFHGFDYTVKGAKVRNERRFVNPFNKKSVSYQKVQDIVKLFDDNGYVLLNVKDKVENDSGLSQKSANRVKYSKIRDKKLIQQLENTKTIILYRAVQIIDGLPYPPMAAKVNGKLVDPIEFNAWEQSDVSYEGTKLKKNSKGEVETDENGIPYLIFKLNKGNGDIIEALFAPYFHLSDSPLNDQFTSAWNRPNLRIMEVEVPISEETSGYRAKHSPKTVGWNKWNSTFVSKQLGGPRDVFLSRYDKPLRLLSNAETADKIAKIVGKNVVIPENAVWDELRDLLIERGVKIGPPTKGQKRSAPIFDKDGNKVKYSKYRQVNPVLREKNPEGHQFHKSYLDKYTSPKKSHKQLENDAAKKIADLGGIDKTLKVALDGDLSTISDTNIYVFKALLSSREWHDLKDVDKTKLADLYHNSLGSEAGRALAARRLGVFNWKDLDSIIAHINAYLAKVDDPEKVIHEVLEETGIDLNTVLIKPSPSIVPSSATETVTETKETPKEEEKDVPLHVKPKAEEKNPLQDPKNLNKVLEVLLSSTKKMDDKFYEFWINAIQSGPTSPIVNIVGNLTNISYDLIAKRAVEATLNKFIFKKKDAASFEEFKHMSKAINWTEAMERAKFAWQHETLVKHSKLDRINVAIEGKLGKNVRIPTRLLAVADEFAKAIIEPIESTSFACRLGLSKGLKGKQLENFIAEQLKDNDSPSWNYGRERGIELTFQTEVGEALNHLISLKNSKTVAGFVTRYFLPFIKGPVNIISKGARVTPLGTIPLARDLFQVAFGQKQFDSESVSRIAEQVIAWGSIMALVSLSGDDEDYPIITGSQGALSATGRTFMRDKIPPYSIRIGVTYYSYKRLDPFATSLALIADGIHAFQAYKGGAKSEEIIKNLIGSVRSQFVDKSFFNAFNQLYQTLSTEGYAFKWGANFASSWMPNVVRQTVGYFDDHINSSSNQSKGREWYENMFYMVVDKAGLLHASPKIDYLGREVKKDSVEASSPLGIMARIFALNPQSPDASMSNADRLLFNYAKQNPESAFYPDVPSYYFRHNKRVIYFTGDNYREYAKDAGELAHKQINNAIMHGILNVNNPTERDIKIIKGIFQKSRKKIKERLIKENKFSF